MSFGVKEQRETRIKKHTRPEGYVCGGCGEEVTASELLCTACRLDTIVGPQDEFNPKIRFTERFETV